MSFYNFGFKKAKEVNLPRECQHCKLSVRPLRNIKGVGYYCYTKFVCRNCWDLVMDDLKEDEEMRARNMAKIKEMDNLFKDVPRDWQVLKINYIL